MATRETFAVVGGDLRFAYVAGALAADGYKVLTSGFDGTDLPPCVTGCTDPAQAISLSDAVILPLPVTVDGGVFNAPFSRRRITLDQVLNALNDRQFVVGGAVPDAVRREVEARGGQIRDYLEREEMAIRNAVPTAEGAIQLAMEELPITLHGANCLVTGYGRVGRALADRLLRLGAVVTVAARRCAALAEAASAGCIPLPLAELPRAGVFDVVFNTVPSELFDRALLEITDRGTLFIDLASKPGGIDFAAAAELRIKTVWALSLPGRVAPRPAGIIIKDTVLNMIREES